jgi:uncharacterized protein involved in exopolysaccharide biosynthesis
MPVTLVRVEVSERQHPEVAPADRAAVYLSAITKRWWLVVAGAVVTAFLTFALSDSKPKLYEGTAKVLLTNSEPVNVLLHATPSTSNDPERDLNTEVALVKLDSVARRVRRELRLPLSTTALLREVTVAPEGTSNVLQIAVRDRVPARASVIATAFAEHFVSSRRQLARSAYDAAARLAQGQLSLLTPAEQRGPRGNDLRTQLRELGTAGALQTGGVQLVDPAAVPTTAVSPRPKFAAAVGGFIGLLLGALAAIGMGSAESRRARAIADEPAPTNGHVEDEGAIVSMLVPSSTSVGTRPVRREEAAHGGRDD